MNRWIEIHFKCACMPAESVIQMRERGEIEDIIEFILRATEAICAEHTRLSPLCVRDTMEYAKIPVTDDKLGCAEGEIH